mgnify:FL=1
MKDIAIYGAGGFGREVACLIQKINDASKEPIWNFVGYFDDGVAPTKDFPYGPVLGGMECANNWNTPLDIAIAIGTPRIIELLVNKINNPNISFPNVISPDLVYHDKDTCEIGIGNIVCTGCFFSCNTKIGNFNQFNGFLSVGHDASIGNFNSFMAGVRISGGVEIGNKTFWGFNSGIVQYKQVEDNVTVGAGTILTRKGKSGTTYIGSPAKAMILPKSH